MVWRPFAGSFASDVGGPASGTRFPARHQPGINHLTLGGPEAGPQFLHASHLRGGETFRRLRSLAEQRLGIEFAAARIVQHSVLDPIQRVALIVDCVGYDVNFVDRNVRVAIHRKRRPKMAADVVMGPVVGRVARDDAVKIGRIALCFDHGFVAALGASVEIGASRLRAVERLENQLVGFGHEMRAAVGEIHDALVVPKRPFGIGTAALMAGVRTARRVTLLQGLHHRCKADGARHTAVSHA